MVWIRRIFSRSQTGESNHLSQTGAMASECDLEAKVEKLVMQCALIHRRLKKITEQYRLSTSQQAKCKVKRRRADAEDQSNVHQVPVFTGAIYVEKNLEIDSSKSIEDIPNGFGEKKILKSPENVAKVDTTSTGSTKCICEQGASDSEAHAEKSVRASSNIKRHTGHENAKILISKSRESYSLESHRKCSKLDSPSNSKLSVPCNDKEANDFKNDTISNGGDIPPAPAPPPPLIKPQSKPPPPAFPASLSPGMIPPASSSSSSPPPPPPPPLPPSPLVQRVSPNSSLNTTNKNDVLMCKLDALMEAVMKTLSLVQSNSKSGNGHTIIGGRAIDPSIDLTPRIAPPKPKNIEEEKVADARELMMIELREKLSKRRVE